MQKLSTGLLVTNAAQYIAVLSQTVCWSAGSPFELCKLKKKNACVAI